MFGITDAFHLALGPVSGGTVEEKPIASSTLSVLYITYQGFSRWNKGKQDRVGFDVKVYAVGWCFGYAFKHFLGDE